jgi:hypothetical protein
VRYAVRWHGSSGWATRGGSSQKGEPFLSRIEMILVTKFSKLTYVVPRFPAPEEG